MKTKEIAVAVAQLKLPLFSEHDAPLATDGSIDAMGLYTLSEQLASQLSPGIRQRMNNPRFLTLMAVGAAVCAAFPDDTVANDKFFTPPYQVFEWFVVEALIRRIEEPEARQGLPGGLKALKAFNDGMHLSASRYLKTASVFGFFGIYRPLAKNLDVLVGNHRLGAFGADLVTIWEAENGLQGFLGGYGEGGKFKKELVKAVEDGLQNGESKRADTWPGWNTITQHLQHRTSGPKEAAAISRKILESEPGSRQALLDFLYSPEGQKTWMEGEGSERLFHQKFRDKAPDHIRHYLDSIIAYEDFSRIIQNTFDESMLVLCSARGRPVKRSEIAELRSIQEASRLLPNAFKTMASLFLGTNFEQSFRENFGDFESQYQPLELVKVLYEHHNRIQSRKLPRAGSVAVELPSIRRQSA